MYLTVPIFISESDDLNRLFLENSENLFAFQTEATNTSIYSAFTKESKVNKKFISHVTRAQRTPSAAATVQVYHALQAVRVSC
jgi:hypothetical protein